MEKLILATLFLLLPASLCTAQDEHVSPFSAVRWAESPIPEVQVNDRWYSLVGAEGVPVDTLTHLAVAGAGRSWQRAYVEWFDWLMNQAEVELDSTANLELTPLDAEAPITLRDVPVTAEKRQNAWQRYYVASRLVEREHAETIPERLGYLTRRIDGTKNVPADQLDVEALYSCVHDGIEVDACIVPEWLSPQAAEVDLANLEWLLENKYSYLTLREVNYRAAIDAIRSGLDEGISRRDFALQVRRLLALFGDGHTRMSLSASALELPEGVVPFRLVDIEGRIAALEWDRSGFVDDRHPFVRSIDGLPVEKWEELAGETAPQGSLPLRRYQTLTEMQRVGYLRALLDLPQRDSIRVTLEDKTGTRTRTVRRVVTAHLPDMDQPGIEGRVLDDNLGYLVIRSMASDEAFLIRLKRYMTEFARTDGLIIDVRGNGGGTRDVLRVLFPYFMHPDDSLHVVNVAALRTDSATTPDHPEGFLSARFAYPVTSSRWAPEEREQIEVYAASFEPERELPTKVFSCWHYMALRPDTTGQRYFYDRPVVVLMNETNFSATDIFLGALKGWLRVTLLGTPSRGGSGYAETYYLPHSRIGVKLSSMASFQPDGMLYEGRGIKPDVQYEMDLAGWRRYLQGDDPLVEMAREVIAEKGK